MGQTTDFNSFFNDAYQVIDGRMAVDDAHALPAKISSPQVDHSVKSALDAQPNLPQKNMLQLTSYHAYLQGVSETSSQNPIAIPTVSTTDPINSLQRQIDDLKSQLAKHDTDHVAPKKKNEDGIKIGGAVRFQYSLNDYEFDNNRRFGDMDFDVFRLDINGKIKGIELSAQYRWYQYMNVLHHGWIGYELGENWKAELGVTRVPFGNLAYNSHSFFFSSAYYVGLEDDYDAGIKFIRETDDDDLRVAYFLTDELGGIDGYVGNRTFRYSYDVVGTRAATEGTFDTPKTPIAEHGSVGLRYVRKLPFGDIGGSILYGGLEGRSGSAGDRLAYALHLNRTIDRWNLQLQFTSYKFDLNDGSDLLAVGAFAFFDTIPSEANLYTANVSYKLPVEIGPITSLTFYNDYSIVTDKKGVSGNSIMNVTGIGVSAGAVYSNVDLVAATDHPFIGGSLGQDAGDWNTRLNVNVGFYF